MGHHGTVRRLFRLGSGGVEVGLSPEERVFLADVVGLLSSVPREDDTDPASIRLRPPVYLGDADANSEWWRYMGEELDAGRQEDRRLYLRVMERDGPATISLGEAEAVLRVLNEGRLALGARIGIEVEEDHDRADEGPRQVLDYMGWVLEDLAEALSRAL